ncbi:hypothetical protein BV22DRAFT_675934 [Leucogyrophana mollusca]|uniref:Uncharacterized protein n=1 Tax=Leucogyrophana mollusca TaxID=85980 RepID=A0ACB8BA81_9AGAM|nr:hypothetical protein BV22DRAFT_675934 [Leucogyrophana mollusca]
MQRLSCCVYALTTEYAATIITDPHHPKALDCQVDSDVGQTRNRSIIQCSRKREIHGHSHTEIRFQWYGNNICGAVECTCAKVPGFLAVTI